MNLVIWPAQILEVVADTVPQDVSVDDLRKLVDEMLEVMRAHNGIGLAAPQVGISWRLFVMEIPGEQPHIFINPTWDKIKAFDPKKSKWTRKLFNDLQILEMDIVPASTLVDVKEGCLSFPGIIEQRQRWDKVWVSFEDLDTREHGLGGAVQKFEGLAAQCIQHECEHLNGITMASKMGPVRRDQVKRKLAKAKRYAGSM